MLAALDGEVAKIYADSGRPSIPPERLLRRCYCRRSTRSAPRRWFVGLSVDEQGWVPTVFTKNCERLLEVEVAHKFLAERLNHKEVRGLLSDDRSTARKLRHGPR